MTTVTLSRVLRSREFFKMYSTAMPVCLWMLFATFIWRLSLTLFHTHSIRCSFESLSKIPSHPKTMKSWSVEFNLNEVISGVATTTFGLPPNCLSFASASPNVRDTESRPGKTLSGPITNSFFSLALAFAGAAVRLYKVKLLNTYWYICPPPSIILLFSRSSQGLWSLLKAYILLPSSL